MYADLAGCYPPSKSFFTPHLASFNNNKNKLLINLLANSTTVRNFYRMDASITITFTYVRLSLGVLRT